MPANYGRFFLWLLVIQLGLYLAASVVGLLIGVISAAIAGIFMFCCSLAIIVIQIRLLILFPGIALNAPGADWESAWQDSRGHAWRFIWVSIVALVPLLIVALVVLLVIAHLPFVLLVLVSALLSAALIVFGGAIAAVLASRFFQLYGRARLPGERAQR